MIDLMDASRTNPGGLENLLSARRSAKSSLEKSIAVAAAIDDCHRRLEEIQQRLPTIEAAVRPIRAPEDALAAVGGHIDRAVGPAAAVLKVFDAVHGLEPSLLSDPSADSAAYVAVLKRLEEALYFLSENCGLAVQWLDDIVEYLDENSVADRKYISTLKASLTSLKEINNPLDGGLMATALEKLESEFRRLVSENKIQEAQRILEILSTNGRIENCIRIYVEVRSNGVDGRIKSLDLKYLEISSEGEISRWSEHLEFLVKNILETEHRLCREIFKNSETWTRCFAEISKKAGILSFLQFASQVADSKNDPIKLLKLLDIFAGLNKLRLDFNRLFNCKHCEDIQNATRDLIKRVIYGACEIFSELTVQIELQRSMPPSDGNVPRIITFMTDYCNKLLGEEYRSVLVQVLVIHRSWKKQKFSDRHLGEAIMEIIRALEVKFQIWSKAYEDSTVSFIFMMNTHWHFYKHLKSTKVGDLLGEAWLKEHDQSKEFYAASYMKDTWAKLPPILSRDGLILFSGGRATARDLVKKRLRSFNEALEEILRRHSGWVIPERDLREKICQLAVQAIVPVYRSYMQNYGPLVEQEASAGKYAKYTAQSLEEVLGSLFQQKPGRVASFSSNPKLANGKGTSG